MALNTEGHFLVKLVLKKYSDASTKTLWLGSRYFLPDELYSGSAEVWGILESISGLGQEMGSVVPTSRTGTITLSGMRGSLGASKRIYDFLEEYLFLNQDITVYSFIKPRDKAGDSSNLKYEFSGKVLDYSIDIQGASVALNVGSELLSTEPINKYVTEQTSTDTEVYQEQTFNTGLPIVFGEHIQVKGIPYLEEKVTDAELGDVPSAYQFLLGSKLGSSNQFSRGDLYLTETLVTTKNYFRNVELIEQPGNDPVFTFSGTNDSNTHENAAPKRWAVKLDLSGLTGSQLITQINVKGIGQNGSITDPSGEIYFQISAGFVIGGKYVAVPIPGAKATKNKSHIATEMNGSGNYEIGPCSFEEPVYLPDNPEYLDLLFLEFWETVPSSSIRQFVLACTDDTGSVSLFKKPIDSSEDWEAHTQNASSPMFVELYGYSYGGAVSNTFHDLISLDLQTAVIHDTQQAPAFDQDWYFFVDGLRDDSSGTITGTPNKLIETSFEAVKLLYYLMKNESLSTWDETRFSTAEALALDISGTEKSEKTYRDVIVEILENSNAKLIPDNEGNASFWTYGVEQDPVAVLTERNCRLESIDTLGVEDIVNEFNVFYGTVPVADGALIKSLNEHPAGKITVSNSESQAVYGKRFVENTFSYPKWINSETTAQAYADYMLIRHARERQVYTVEVPYWFENFREIRLWDKVQLSHIDNPARNGGSPPNTTRPLGDGVDWAEGWILRNAQRYEFRVIGRSPSYNLESKEPTITLKLLILNNPDEVH